MSSQILGFCECGCGEKVSGIGNRFINYHHRKGQHQSGESKQKISAMNKGIPNSPEHNAKISATKKGIPNSPEHNIKISMSMTGIPNSPERNAKISVSRTGIPNSPGCNAKISVFMTGKNTGENNPMFGTHQTAEQKQKQSKRMSGENNPNFGKHPSEKTIRKIKENQPDHSGENNPMFGRTGENNPNWKGGISSGPYCPKFNEPKKEETREDFGYTCFRCGITQEEQMADQRARGKRPQKLCIHHIDYDKMQGCNGIKWKLVPLCTSCNLRVNKDREKWEKFFIEKLYFREFSLRCQNSEVLFR